MARRMGCVVGLVVAVVLTAATFWALAIELPRQGEMAVPRIVWVILKGIEALPDPLELPALALFSLVIGLAGGFLLMNWLGRRMRWR